MTFSFQKIEALISQLSFKDKAKLLYRMSKEIGGTFPGIETTKGVCGGSACIIRARIPVWTLVAFKNGGLSDAGILQSYPTLRKQDLNNAWAYVFSSDIFFVASLTGSNVAPFLKATFMNIS